jgi:Transmembrane domain of unknown function (DUF3566)
VSETSSSPGGGGAPAAEGRSYGPAPAAARPAEATLAVGQNPGAATADGAGSAIGGGSASASGAGSSGIGGGLGGSAANAMSSTAQTAARSFARLGSLVNDAVSAVRPAANSNASSSSNPHPHPGPNPATRPVSAVGPQVRVRKARLRVARVDPWSVMKVSFVLSIAMGIVTLVATAVVWKVLESLGVFSSLNKTIGDLTSSGTGSTSTGFSVTSFASFGNVEGVVVIISLVDIVLVTALATLGAYLYNLASGFVGGFEVTLAEDQ